MKKLAVVILAALLTNSCAKEEFDLGNVQLQTWEPTLAVTLINSRLGIDRIITEADNSLIQVDPNTQFVTLVYESGEYTFSFDNIINIADLTVSQSVDGFSPVDIPVLAETTITSSFTIQDTLPANGAVIQEVLLKAGLLTSAINITGDMQVTANITIGNVVNNSQPLEINLSNDIPSFNQDLRNYSLVFSGGAPGNVVSFDVDLSLTYPLNTFIRTTDAVGFSFGLADIEYSRVFGDFGQLTIDLPADSFLLNLFSGAQTEGQFSLAAPSLNFNFKSTIGAGIDLDYKEISSINTATGLVSPFQVNDLPNNVTIPAAQVSGKFSPIQPGLGGFTISSGALSEILSPTPKFLKYDIDIELNPGTAPFNNFIDDTSKITFSNEIEMPLEGYIGEFIVQDTVPFSFGQTLDEIEKLELLLIVDNGFPVDVDLQIYLLNASNQIIDSLVKTPGKFIPSANSGSDGRVDQATEKTQSRQVIGIDRATAQNMLLSTNMLVWASMQTEQAQNQKSIRIHNDYELLVKLGVLVQASLNFSESEE